MRFVKATGRGDASYTTSWDMTGRGLHQVQYGPQKGSVVELVVESTHLCSGG